MPEPHNCNFSQGSPCAQANCHDYTSMLRSQTARGAASALLRPHWTCSKCIPRRLYSQKPEKRESPDHRKLGHQQELFITSVYSPGSPIFLPNGARIFNRLVSFLRNQYVRYGFEEVITPTIYKKSLWAKSGHLENYASDMYTVTGSTRATPAEQSDRCCETKASKVTAAEDEDDSEYGLKPMNCPGHCLIFASKLHSYRDLPVRYADFSPLHRNEISGALSGLTRVRRFHQDDGHIFCRPSQVEDEIRKTLDFVKVVYTTLKLGVSYRLALSTRPKDHFIGTEDEWNRAEDRLRRALNASGMPWSVNEGDGAFYGPKIDIVLKDSDGKEHQTATVQLDFQLPKRFELEYQAPAPEYEARGETTEDPALLAEYGPVRPVMIHRAVLGSVERLMALLIENYDGKWPFWLSPKQAIILTVNTSAPVVDWADKVRDILLGNLPKDYAGENHTQLDNGIASSGQTGLAVDLDTTARSLGAKIREARNNGYSQILVVGDADVQNKQVSLGKERMTPGEMRDRMMQMVDRFE
ncbi:hypothetical protein NQ176_g7848 [Zarea fungicola]|uniref:Uncharacterized protein n=1 Tax=Zarea fungicola TaxID=93591 RepID=A0ACC1MX82_9HYPO|nr:hypothetical protein NQ176_g7848 [Lecanicillium fungicola]